MKKISFFLIVCGLSLSLLPATPLLIPELLEGPDINMTMQKGKLELPMGTSPSFGYNGDYLGPTLRFRRGDWADIKVKNDLGESTTLHWHGMHIPAEFDGGPHQVIEPGILWNPVFQIKQKAATLWYHPHLMGKTGEHVYKGLAGLVILEDDYSDALKIPRDYGVNDIPLILQDRKVNRKGEIHYSPSMPDVMHGYLGNIVLVNGQFEPELTVSKGTIRFRLLNGSNSSLMRIKFSDEREFTIIASDGGFLPASVQSDELIMSPGERFEILLDLKKKESLSLLVDLYGGESFQALTINASQDEGSFFSHEGTNRAFTIPDESTTSIQRQFLMETRGMNRFSINGKQMDMNRIDFKPSINSSEIWEIVNVKRGMMSIPHSFHVHDVQFRIISINGQDPPPHLSGPKDTVLLMPSDTVKIALRFEDYDGIYMYHCHFLEHEDRGMMGQFEVQMD